ncbi:MAG: hypothetical protein AB3N64_02585 [Puniceicoccaceae bacterium]
MSATDLYPGKVWPAKRLTSDYLEKQWTLELNHRANSLDLEDLTFTEEDWKEWDWHANLALQCNERRSGYPDFIRNLILPQMEVNQHLIKAFGKLLIAWRQWENLARLRLIEWKRGTYDPTFFIISAECRLSEAKTRFDSLSIRKQFGQIVSVRQQRFFQHLAWMLKDFEPLVESVTIYAREAHPDIEEIPAFRDDLIWHSRAAYALVGHLEERPTLADRLRVQRNQINRMLGIACLSHSKLLKAILKATQQ